MAMLSPLERQRVRLTGGVEASAAPLMRQRAPLLTAEVEVKLTVNSPEVSFLT